MEALGPASAGPFSYAVTPTDLSRCSSFLVFDYINQGAPASRAGNSRFAAEIF
jgi:hypothetical protein